MSSLWRFLPAQKTLLASYQGLRKHWILIHDFDRSQLCQSFLYLTNNIMVCTPIIKTSPIMPIFLIRFSLTARNTRGTHILRFLIFREFSHSFISETCITGHRSSSCRHTDRPMLEVKKKGRPITICEHCRELRKTKQVYINCACGTDDSAEPSTIRTFKEILHHCEAHHFPCSVKWMHV